MDPSELPVIIVSFLYPQAAITTLRPSGASIFKIAFGSVCSEEFKKPGIQIDHTYLHVSLTIVDRNKSSLTHQGISDG